MPQVDLKYSSDITLDTKTLFEKIETTINTLDSSTGICKCRAYPAKEHLHTHMIVKIYLLRKPHRDEVFMKNCLAALETAVSPLIPSNTHYAIELLFSRPYYLTKNSTP